MHINTNAQADQKPTIQCYSGSSSPVQFGYFEFILQNVHGVIDCSLVAETSEDTSLLNGISMFDPGDSRSVVNLLVTASEVEKTNFKTNPGNVYDGFIGAASVDVTNVVVIQSGGAKFRINVAWNHGINILVRAQIIKLPIGSISTNPFPHL
jgi:hypothetical protein